jgi:alpha-tubulin suppressor-like RCC1 family protein
MRVWERRSVRLYSLVYLDPRIIVRPDSLGPGQHTQYSLLPVPQFTYHVVTVALGQDHTLALTSDGEVLSWGLNRFSQLGYVVEQPTPSGPLHMRAMEEPIQAAARKIVGPLKKETVIGVAACKTSSACWTSTDVFTWGTNGGQLGSSFELS